MLSKACIVGAYQKKLEELARLPNVELTVVVPPFWRDERGISYLERVHTSGYELIVEPMAFNGHFHIHFYPGLNRKIRRIRPQVVHIDEEPYDLVTFHTLWLARHARAKTLFFTWQNLLRRYPPPFCWTERYVYRHADYAIMGNQEAVTVCRAKGYRGPAVVIPQFGIDPDMYQPRAETRDPGRGFVVGYVGRLVPAKGVDILLQALSGLDGVWQATVVGSGPEQPTLMKLARSLGIEDRVHFEGPISSIQMPHYYHQLDVLVLPSRTQANWKEQFGRVLVEAMACGVPVIGSDCGEIPHVIGDAGLVFPEGDVTALRAHLASLMADPERRAELAHRGRERALTHYTQQQVALATYEVYRQLTG